MIELNDDMLEIKVVVPAEKLGSLYAFVGALLGGVSPAAIATGNVGAAAPKYIPNTGDRPETVAAPKPEQSSEASEDTSTELDAHGHPWSADLHASTKGKTKDGLWRMKVGVTRPAPMPGFPVEDAAAPASEPEPAPSTSTETTGATESSPSTDAAAPTVDDDDEFAAFREAAAKSDAEDAQAKASIPARKWTDADLGALCNQAAVKLGDPVPVKAIIASFVPEGEVAHSRNIPDDKRAEFAAAVEAKAGIEFAG